jgi:benzoate-CoA ligase
VVLNGSRDASEDLEKEIKDHVKQTLANYKYPRWVEFIDELPKTATGKIKRFVLRQREEQ